MIRESKVEACDLALPKRLSEGAAQRKFNQGTKVGNTNINWQKKNLQF
jgi:hypothetical protein